MEREEMVRTFSAALMAVACIFACAGEVHAHGVWLGARCDKTCIVLGDGPKDNGYAPSMVTGVKGYSAELQPVAVGTVDRGDHVQLDLPENAAVVSVDFDYGYWSKGPDGRYVNKPMDEVPGATLGTHAVKFNVSYLDAAAKVAPVPGLDMQFVPSVNPAGLRMGDVFEVQLLHKGKPMPDTEVIFDVVNDLNGTARTDADGRVKVTVRNNALNVVGVEVTVPEPGSDKCTQTKYFASLSFTCYPDYDD